MSWIGGSLSSLTGQLSNLTKDILTEGTEEVSDPTTELQLAKDKIQQLDSTLSSLKHENERLKRINKDLEEKAEASELQINAISSQYRAVLETREKEINSLKHQYQELLEQHARTTALSPPPDGGALENSPGPSQSNSWTSPALDGHDFASLNYDGDEGDWDFDDSIRLQKDNNNLRTELQRLQVQVKHWKSVAGQLGQHAGQTNDQQAASAEILDLQHRAKNYEAELAKKTEELQQQATSLHEHHRQKVSTLKLKHQAELDAVRQQLSALEQQLVDAGDGVSGSQRSGSGTLPESDRLDHVEKQVELQRQLAESVQEKEKYYKAQLHLQGELAELQQEVETLQNQVTQLSGHLKESESQRAIVDQQLVAVQNELKNQLTQSLKSAKDEQEKALAEAEAAIENIGGAQAKVASECLEVLEKENLLLRSEKLKCEEQITLLEKAANTLSSERQTLQLKVRDLQSKLKAYTEVGEDSDDTLDTDLSSVGSSSGYRNAALHIDNDDIERELERLKTQLRQQSNDLSNVEMERTDWLMEREALEDVITELRQKAASLDEQLHSVKSSKASSHESETSLGKEAAAQIMSLKEEISSLQTDKSELENALEELDSQHSQALEQLIKNRDQLASQLAEKSKQIQEQQKTIEELSVTITQLKESQAAEDRVDGSQDGQYWEEKCKQLELEIAQSKDKKSSSSDVNLEKEVADLRQKLHKGGLVINDLHMDKQELQEELKAARDEVAAKVGKIKEMREANSRLAHEKKDLEVQLEDMKEQLSELEEEVEKWQQVNEDRQLQQGEQESCQVLKSKLAAAEKEKELFSLNFNQLLTQEPKAPQAGGEFKFEDEAFKTILEEEAKVRRQIEADGRLIQDLKKQVQKLYEDKQQLKKELLQQETLHSKTTGKLVGLEKEKKELKLRLDSLAKEKSDLEETLSKEVENGKALAVKLASAQSKLDETAKQNEELANEFLALQNDRDRLVTELESQKKHYDSYIEELKASQDLGAESLQLEHQKILDLQREKNLEIDRLDGMLKVKAGVESTLEEKNQEVETLKHEVQNFKEQVSEVKSEISRLEKLCADKDREIEELKSRMSQFDRDLYEIEESVSVAEDQHKASLSAKDEELLELRQRNAELNDTLKQLNEVLSQSGEKVDDVNELRKELAQLKSEMLAEEDSRHSLTQLENELAGCNDVIRKLNEDLTAAKLTIECHEAGIADLNQKADEQRRCLENSERDVARQKSTIAVLRQSSVDKETLISEVKAKLSYLTTILTPQQMEMLKNYALNQPMPALEYKEVMAIEFSRQSETGEAGAATSDSQTTVSDRSDYATNGYIVEEDVDSTASEHERCSLLEKEMNDLRGRLKEKDAIVVELQKSNSTLLSLLEKGGGDKSLSAQVTNHKLEAELSSLRAEKEQMVAVVTEKSRENSTLKSEVHRLMGALAAGQAALNKLQEDNRALQQRQNSPPRESEDEDDMRREALANMARLIRDRETEIEALKQKNDTLLAVLQSSGESQAAIHLAPLLKDKEILSQQIANMSSEREQLIACVTQKHSECLAYHAESQRFSALLVESQAACEQARNEHAALIPKFEDKCQALVATQNELIKCKQKITDLEVRYGELIHRSNSQDHSNTNEASPLEEELQRLRQAETELRVSVSQRDEKIHTLTLRVSALEEEILGKETECAHLRKQVENSKFQLTGLMTEMADIKQEREQIQKKNSLQDSESASIREAYNKISLEAREKDNSISVLKEQVSTLTSLLQEQQGEQGHITKLMRDNEAAVAITQQLQQERDYNAMVAQQRLHEATLLRNEITQLKEKELKTSKEIERLRRHLIEMEDGYTKEALESEEREKDLRNKLALAEERLMSSSSREEMASQEASRQIESLQQQLQHIASQRDAAYMQVANIQEQCQQYATSLSNLQLVLEHFQKEKDSAIALETEYLQNECRILKIELEEQNKELAATKDDLSEALDGLEAANRLSELLDRKEEALAALKEEVQLREKALEAAEEEIRKLSSSTEAKVDKTLMHNMVMTWLTSPESKRMEIVHLIGHILCFSDDDFQKIEVAQNKISLLSGIFRKQAGTPTSTPVKPANQSFSQLFVKFLEKESSPPPSPVRLPAEAMAAETQHRHKPAFNPFTAPRHVVQDGQRSSSPSSHLLIANDISTSPTPFFTPLTSLHTSESAILKNVLEKR
ncbi:thyroid receptor-interacting protein 11-like [Physella acuta]|uniref:thyroid receptor-interacting protein 11-like n=1 Tax=Physella acuta TaxID=109671 RepID=UPI0027DD7D6A|nr:thyroid receptor-interacting protein 11-like [Physella acuta]